MLRIKYGTVAVPIGVDEFLVRCPCCETHTPTDVMISSRYCHFYWVPFAPTGKEATLICTKCGLKRAEIPFDAGLISNFEEIRSKFKHPLYTYAGLGMVVAMFLLILLNIFGPK